MKWRLPRSARIAISAALLLGLIAWVGPDELIETVSGLQWGWFAASVVAMIAAVAVGGLNVVVLTRALLPTASVTAISVAYLRAWALGMVAPGKVGDLTYAHFLSDDETSWGPGLAVAILDKAVTFVLTAVVAVGGLALYVSTTDAIYGTLFALLAVAGLGFLLFSDRVRSVVRSRVLGKYAERFSGFSDGVRDLTLRRRGILALNVGLTVIRIIVAGLAGLFMFRALGVTVPLFEVIVVTLISQLVALIPITFGGLGIRQGTSIALYARISGIPSAAVLSASLLETVVLYAGVALIFAALGVERRS